MAIQGPPDGLQIPAAARAQQATPAAGASYQYFFLSIVMAIIVVFIVFPGAALGVFYPPCIYNFPRPAAVTPAGGNLQAMNGQVGLASPSVTLAPSPLPTDTPIPAQALVGTLTPAPVNTVAVASPIPASIATATAEARDLLVAGRLGLQDDAANYSVYAHCLANFNSFIDYTVKFLAIAAAVITTISATQGWRVIGFTSGALVTALTAFQTTFPMENRASFYQSVANQVDSVVAEVRYSVLDEHQLRQVRMGFDQVKSNAAAGPVVRAVATQTALPSVTASASTTTTPGATPSASAAPVSVATPNPSAAPAPNDPAPTQTPAPGAPAPPG